ncbi:MAG: chemotaxis response regulator protein-glutamate methylesterase [Clostridia bacterium]|nr:chemotaxis response regulator protein-glutamate methylesterase [Clostridia bacterium]
MTSSINVFIVDDSAFMRQVITKILHQDKHLKVIGRARNGKEALERIPILKPDVVTLDIEMPVMDGLETLERLKKLYPVPVIMLSSLTQKGARVTMRALELGAVDFIPKPSEKKDFDSLANELPAKVKLAATVDVAAKISVPAKPRPARAKLLQAENIELVIIGTSTGGPSALQQVIPKLPKDLPAGVLIIQHMPKGFTKALAERLNQHSQLAVREAQNGDVLEPGTALVAPAGTQTLLRRWGSRAKVALKDETPIPTHFRPSVDVTMLSAAKIFGGSILGVIMTGMGNDGVRGLEKVKEHGGKALAEAEETCVVFGMPRAAIQAGLIDEVQPLHRLAGRIIDVVKKS